MSQNTLIEQATTNCEFLNFIEGKHQNQAIIAKKNLETQIKKTLSSPTKDNYNGLSTINASVAGWLAYINEPI